MLYRKQLLTWKNSIFEIDLTGRRAEKRGAIAGDIQPRRPSLAIACGNLTAIKACIWQMI
ncbi:hypothetical protein ACFQAT_08795 [Undibacterium arcticum]|uniref:Uncharacterized protein n=1 Tax=Undibacterium arcticum TaxID=1762892 RepID=A0ABV7F3P5_9BURK